MEGTEEIYIPGPSDSGSSGVGSAIGSGVGSIWGPIGSMAGGLIGGLFDGGKAKGSNNGLQGALQSGLGSLFGSKSSSTSTQSVETAQSTNVNVSNVLGSRTFGNYDSETGEFDTFQAISDIFAIKKAQDDALASQSTTPATTQTATKPLNFMPLIVVGALAAGFFLMRKGK